MQHYRSDPIGLLRETAKYHEIGRKRFRTYSLASYLDDKGSVITAKYSNHTLFLYMKFAYCLGITTSRSINLDQLTYLTLGREARMGGGEVRGEVKERDIRESRSAYFLELFCQK